MEDQLFYNRLALLFSDYSGPISLCYGHALQDKFQDFAGIAYIQLFFSNPSERFGEFGHVKSPSIGGVDFCQRMIIAA
jgi:hypothetical protein